MSVVVSRENPRFKSVHRVARSAPLRRRTATTLIEGAHLCQAFFERYGAPRQCVVAESALAHPEAIALVRAVPGDALLVLSDPLFRSISQLEHDTGIAFMIDVPHPTPPHAIDEPAILLDRLQDPGNLGSILRSSAAAGITSIYCAAETVSAWSPKVLRAGMGAHFWLRIFEGCDLAALVRGAQIPVLATSSHARQSLYEVDLAGPVAWLFGNEGQGLAHALEEGVRSVRIPQPGGMESLNVAAAAAICLFEGVRQRV